MLRLPSLGELDAGFATAAHCGGTVQLVRSTNSINSFATAGRRPTPPRLRRTESPPQSPLQLMCRHEVSVPTGSTERLRMSPFLPRASTTGLGCTVSRSTCSRTPITPLDMPVRQSV